MRGDIMKGWKTTILLLAEYFIVPLAVSYFVSMKIYGQWQFRDFYTNAYYWVFLGTALFFGILVSVLRKHLKKATQKTNIDFAQSKTGDSF